MIDFNQKRGLTLIETLVAVAILGLMMGAVSGLIASLYRTYGYGLEQSMAINEARRGIEVLVREIRTARTGDDGAYPIETAAGKEFVFYSDIDSDGLVERVRYFLGTVGYGDQVTECETFSAGGSCDVQFSDFLQGGLISAQVRVLVDGDFGAGNEYADIYANTVSNLGRVCQSGCNDCPSNWQGTSVFDVTNHVENGSISLLADARSTVDPICPHAMKARFEFSWQEDLSAFAHEFKKGVTKPIIGQNGQVSYPSDQEDVSILTSYVRNSPPIFEYFDAGGNKVEDLPARLIDVRMVKVHLIVNVRVDRAPNDFELESYVQIRNLKEE